jgi:hypothetical protein
MMINLNKAEIYVSAENNVIQQATVINLYVKQIW